MNTVVHGARIGGGDEALSHCFFDCNWNMNNDDDSGDFSHRECGHVLFNVERRAGEVEACPLGDDGHSSHHARAQRGGQEIGWGERKPSAVVVERGIGDDFHAAGAVFCDASESIFIGGRDVDHEGKYHREENGRQLTLATGR